MSLIVVVTNKSQLADVSDYNYQVLVGDGTVERSRVIAHGEVKGHHRIHGWASLIRQVLEEEGHS